LSANRPDTLVIVRIAKKIWSDKRRNNPKAQGLKRGQMVSKMIIHFTVYGEPTAKGRPRFARRGAFSAAYTPAKTVRAESDFRAQALAYKPTKPLETPLIVNIKVFRSIPKSMSKKRAELADRGIIRPTTKPDKDNYEKLINDALNGIFWRDDSQIVYGRTGKYYSKNPRI
jgi:Holliday junction resolvase RusA-like endonuclease